MDRLSVRESLLTEKAGNIGYDVLDAIVQANVNLESLSTEDLQVMLERFETRSRPLRLYTSRV